MPVNETESTLVGYYNRLGAGGAATGDKWVDIRFRAGRGLQSADMNELQTLLNRKFKSMGDAIFNEGAVIDGAVPQMVDVEGDSQFKADNGYIYFAGSIHYVPSETLDIPLTGKVTIGIRYREYEITEIVDPALRDPALGTRNYQEPGAGRRVADWLWGWVQDADTHDGKEDLLDGEGNKMWTLFPIFEVEDGVITVKEPPPIADAILELIAKYDREANGNYVVRGLVLEFTKVDGSNYVFNLREGLANILGYKIEQLAGRRLTYPIDPNTQVVEGESHPITAEVDGTAQVWLNRDPLAEITLLRGVKRKTVTVTRNAVEDFDELPDASVVAVLEVKQGLTTYTPTTDYVHSGDNIDWTPGGAEPDPGDTYSVTYTYVTDVEPIQTFPDHLVFDTLTSDPVDGLVAGQLVQIDYTYKLPRIDLIVLNRDGTVERLTGVPQRRNPVAPKPGAHQIALAQVQYTWTDDPAVSNVAVRAVTMDKLQQYEKRIDDAYDLIAQQELRINSLISDPTAKKGVFVDPFYDDDLRDSGREQTAAIGDDTLNLPIQASANQPSNVANRQTWHTLPFVLEEIIVQPNKTGCMKINPYQSFEPVPARVKLTPSSDFWVTYVTQWASPIWRYFETTHWDARRGNGRAGHNDRLSTGSAVVTADVNQKVDTTIRVRSIGFQIEGFGPGETLSSVTFDGVSVTPP